MSGLTSPNPVSIGFERETKRIAIEDVIPLRIVTEALKKSPKYGQIRSSIREAGLVEPPAVARDRSASGKYLLVDGHLRIAVLREMGVTEVDCLIAIDDEAYTYNKRISRLAIIQEHQMILNAIERGVPEAAIAQILNVNVGNIRMKRRLLVGLCPEVVEMLEDKHVPMNTFSQLRKLKPLRQIEAAQLMVAMNKYSTNYAKSLVGATSPAHLVDSASAKKISNISDEKLALMEQESEKLDREFRLLEESYGEDHLNLVVATGYIKRLIDNAPLVRYLSLNYPELLTEFQKITASHEAGR